MFEPFPVGGRRPGVALVDVDDVDTFGRPAQGHGPAAQVVLAKRGLSVVGDLSQGGLADVEVGVTGKAGSVDLSSSISTHGGTTSWV